MDVNTVWTVSFVRQTLMWAWPLNLLTSQHYYYTRYCTSIRMKEFHSTRSRLCIFLDKLDVRIQRDGCVRKKAAACLTKQNICWSSKPQERHADDNRKSSKCGKLFPQSISPSGTAKSPDVLGLSRRCRLRELAPVTASNLWWTPHCLVCRPAVLSSGFLFYHQPRW